MTISQKELLLNSGLGFVEYNSLQIETLKKELPSTVQHAVFTSKNAVKSVLDVGTNISKCYCVGEKTKKILEENNCNVVEMAESAADLAKIITKKYKKVHFLYFSGNMRRDELPSILVENSISYQEIVVYNTYKFKKKFQRSFDGVFFFSPSGVESYVSVNDINDAVAFCIGNTTALEAQKHTEKIIIANKPTVENVIVQAVKYFETRI